MEIYITDAQYKRASKFLELTGIKEIDEALILSLEMTRRAIRNGVKNDYTSLLLSQSWKYRWVSKFNYRSLQNLAELRLSPHAHYQIREVVEEMLCLLPSKHKFLFKDIVDKVATDSFKVKFNELIEKENN